MTLTVGLLADRVGGRMAGPTNAVGPQSRANTADTNNTKDNDPKDTNTTGALDTADAAGVTVTDVTHDSREVEPGHLFCCVVGDNVDGHRFGQHAANAGASALLVERVLDVGLPQIVVPDVRAAMGPAAAEVHGHPSKELTVVGVTGTNGKSSIVQLMADIWSQVGVRNEIVGTLVGARTTPEGPDLQRAFRQAADRSVQAMAIEVSSHALALHRVDGVDFAAAVFTNLGHDHLDFHHTMDDYFEAKASLFEAERSAAAIVNTDDPYGRRLADRVAVPLTGYSLADAVDLRFDGPISHFRWRDQPITLQLAGAHNVSNAVAAATCAQVIGIDPVDIADALCATSPVRGRFEAVDAGQPFHIAVDYAHTPDALGAALTAARQVAGDRRVIVVFGCGGDRDVQKRAEMGRVAEQGAEVVVVTSDNPRSEDPLAIIDAIVAGMADPTTATVEPDRQGAIDTAVSAAEPGDVVLIAGKGHETYQIIGDRTIDFDDRRAALRALGVAA
jgi:UDP-N-acetylmuramoyl-L-alanyl-D-glutamate--2,6-diaminopimelate ligase